MSGWIKLRRSLKYWEWYDDHNATRLLIHLLVSVNYEDKKWKGILIKSGSMVLSWQTLSKNSFMTIRKCRTAMDKLVKSKEVTRYVTNKFQVVTLLKWDQIQIIDNHIDKLNNKQVTDKGQTNDKQVTITKEYKEVKEYKNTINNKKKKVFNFRKELLAFGFKESLVNDWLKVRKTKKATNTETSFRNFIIEIHKSNLDYNLILEKCVVNSWSGFKNSWLEKEKSSAKKEKTLAEQIKETHGLN